MRSIDVELLDDLKTALWEGTLTAFCMVIFITTITISVSKKEGNKVFGLELVGSALVQTNSKPFKVVGAQ